MSKKLRIKRSRSKYAQRFKPLKFVIYLLVISLVFFLGWTLYPTVRDFIVGESPSSAESSESDSGISSSEHSSESSGSASQDESSSSVPESSSAESSLPEASEPEDAPEGTRAIFLPAELLNDTVSLADTVSAAKAAGFNAVLIELKDDEGYVMYSSAVPRAKKSISDNAYDLVSVISYLKSEGLEVIGRMHSFHDHMGGKAYRPMGIYYMNESFLWLDDYPDKGGRSWLNPYSEDAAAYITDLSLEAADAGVDSIIFAGFSFPTKIGIESANFGELAETVGKQEMLSMRMQQITSALKEKNTTAYFFAEGPAVLGGDNYIYHGDPLNIAVDGFSTSLYPSDIASNKLDSSLGITDSLQNPYQSVSAQLALLLPKLKSDAEFLPFIQGFSDSSFTCTAEEISSQLKALSDAEISSYILYNPTGEYNFAD